MRATSAGHTSGRRASTLISCKVAAGRESYFAGAQSEWAMIPWPVAIAAVFWILTPRRFDIKCFLLTNSHRTAQYTSRSLGSGDPAHKCQVQPAFLSTCNAHNFLWRVHDWNPNHSGWFGRSLLCCGIIADLCSLHSNWLTRIFERLVWIFCASWAEKWPTAFVCAWNLLMKITVVSRQQAMWSFCFLGQALLAKLIRIFGIQLYLKPEIILFWEIVFS